MIKIILDATVAERPTLESRCDRYCGEHNELGHNVTVRGAVRTVLQKVKISARGTIGTAGLKEKVSADAELVLLLFLGLG